MRSPVHERRLATDEGITTWEEMAVILTFLLGIGNFALHKAVLESRHPMLRELPRFVRPLGGRATLLVEFVLLVVALLLVANGHLAWGWGYLAYSALNGIAGWLILSRRV